MPQPRQLSPLTEAHIAELLAPYLQNVAIPDGLINRLSAYLHLLLRWNARTNLTSVREPEQIVQRHFGESLFAGVHLASRLPTTATLLDFGSGAGFPGLPIQLLLPRLRVTLAESQGKKASFLHEVARTLPLETEIWSHRVEAMPAERRFEAVTLRAVDRMPQALEAAKARVQQGGWLVTLAAEPGAGAECYPVPNSEKRWLVLEQI